MFSGTPPSLIDSQRVSPRPFANGLFSRDFVRCRETTLFTLEHSISYITAEAGISSSFFSFFRRKAFRHESARLSRISPTHSNQPDSLESAGLSFTIPATESRGSSPTASFHRAIALHSYPQLRVSAVSPHPPSRDFSGSFGFVG